MDVQLRAAPVYTGRCSIFEFGSGKTLNRSFSLRRSSKFSCCVNTITEAKISKSCEVLETMPWKIGISFDGGGDRWDFDQFIRDRNRQSFFVWPHYDTLNFNVKMNDPLPFDKKPVSCRTVEHFDIGLKEVIEYAKRALAASREAASLFTENSSFEDNIISISETFQDHMETVRSSKHQERESILRKAPKKSGYLFSSQNLDLPKNENTRSESKNLHGFLMWQFETSFQLTYEEECNLIMHVQNMLTLEDAKVKLCSQLNREPSMSEWADAVDLTIHTLRSQLNYGLRDREKLINANLAMVVYTAKQYQGRGLSYNDLLQAGIMGLTKSMEKFRPGIARRFSFYAFWWIRQSIRKTIFQRSRTIHLPIYIINLMHKVFATKKSFFREGNHSPSNDELAKRMGISLEKLDKLLFETRVSFSLDQKECKEQNATVQETNADKTIEIPDITTARQLMKQHTLKLLTFLEPNERLIVSLRFGLDNGYEKSFYEIGNLVGCSKEGARKIMNRAMEKLRQFLTSHGLHAYKDLIT